MWSKGTWIEFEWGWRLAPQIRADILHACFLGLQATKRVSERGSHPYDIHQGVSSKWLKVTVGYQTGRSNERNAKKSYYRKCSQHFWSFTNTWSQNISVWAALIWIKSPQFLCFNSALIYFYFHIQPRPWTSVAYTYPCLMFYCCKLATKNLKWENYCSFI